MALEGFHAGTVPDSHSGDFSDVVVKTLAAGVGHRFKPAAICTRNRGVLRLDRGLDASDLACSPEPDEPAPGVMRVEC